jgi:branched-chain amino acid transport system ATP-binding protein
MVCLIGANGAGKTSTLKALARLMPSHGEIHYGAERIDASPPHELIRKGLALVPEGRGIFARLTVAENLAMGAYHRSDKADIAADLERIHGLLPRLKERSAQVAGTLSGGEQQMLAIGRALMGRPKLLLLDEPSMGLAPLMVEKVFEVIRAVAAEGMTILLVEQNAKAGAGTLLARLCHGKRRDHLGRQRRQAAGRPARAGGLSRRMTPWCRRRLLIVRTPRPGISSPSRATGT